MSQSVATIWIDGKPAYMVIELYHVHETDMPLTIRLYSNTESLSLDGGIQPCVDLEGQPIEFPEGLEFCSEGNIWSGKLPAETVTRLIRSARDADQLAVSLTLKNDCLITGTFSTSGLDTSYTAGFNWKLHYRPYWEATRLGRFSFEPR